MCAALSTAIRGVLRDAGTLVYTMRRLGFGYEETRSTASKKSSKTGTELFTKPGLNDAQATVPFTAAPAGSGHTGNTAVPQILHVCGRVVPSCYQPQHAPRIQA